MVWRAPQWFSSPRHQSGNIPGWRSRNWCHLSNIFFFLIKETITISLTIIFYKVREWITLARKKIALSQSSSSPEDGNKQENDHSTVSPVENHKIQPVPSCSNDHDYCQVFPTGYHRGTFNYSSNWFCTLNGFYYSVACRKPLRWPSWTCTWLQ